MNNLRRNALGSWVPLMDFATQSGISLSTLRRHIKANKVTYKIEKGRYLLWNESSLGSLPNESELTPEQAVLKKVQEDLLKAHEEIAELKMLISLYEETSPSQNTPQKSNDETTERS